MVWMAAISLIVTGCVTPFFRDPSLDAARVRLMEAAITRDQSAIHPVLAPDFMWREDVPPLDEEPYDFWNRNKLWQAFRETIMAEPERRDGLMISPRAALRESYKGPRLAWRKVGAEWRLAYFYPGTAMAQ